MESEKNHMRTCIIWGTGNDYDRLYNSIRFEELKGNIHIAGAVTKKENMFAKFIDGIPLIASSELCDVQFDYIIVCSNLHFNEICDDIQDLGIERNKILMGNVFSYARFDFSKYISLIENPVSIISDDCWGGEVYHMLALTFSSPTINIAWEKEEYAKFISDLPYYLRQPLKCGREGNFETGEYPIGVLGEGDRQVQMELIHNISFEEAEEQWERRRQRVNFDNIFVKFGFDKNDNWELCMNVFDNLNYNKICLFPEYMGKRGYINAGFYNRWVRWNYLKQRVVSFRIEDYLRDSRCTRSAIDILGMLNGETDCFRDSD